MTQPVEVPRQVRTLAYDLAHSVEQCDLTNDRGDRQCRGRAVAMRWEDGFSDRVCHKHAESAETRPGAQVVYAPGQAPDE